MNHYLKNVWKRPEYFSTQQLPQDIRSWLLYSHSMTHQLKHACQLADRKFSIKVLNEQLELMPQSICDELNSTCRYAYIREVQLYAGKKVVMYAKSFMPKNEHCILKRQFRGLGHKPLGNLLFTNSINRSQFNLAKIFPEKKEYHYLDSDLLPYFIWARKSCFFNNQPFLLLIEYFSSNFFALMKEKTQHE